MKLGWYFDLGVETALEQWFEDSNNRKAAVGRAYAAMVAGKKKAEAAERMRELANQPIIPGLIATPRNENVLHIRATNCNWIDPDKRTYRGYRLEYGPARMAAIRGPKQGIFISSMVDALTRSNSVLKSKIASTFEDRLVRCRREDSSGGSWHNFVEYGALGDVFDFIEENSRISSDRIAEFRSTLLEA